MLKGADVSKYQGTVDMVRMMNEGIDFIIIRAGYGCPDPGQSVAQYTDTMFKANRDAARAAGILRGYYWFTYPTVNTPEGEANAFCDVVLPLQEGEILALDIEGNIGPDPVGWSKRFLDKVFERTGVRPIIYINQSMNDNFDWSPVVNGGYGVWLAQWDGVADPQNEVSDWPFVAFEQYSSKGNIGGENPVDMDSFNGSREQFLKYGYHAPVVTSPTPTVDPKDQKIAELTATIEQKDREITGKNNELDTFRALNKTQVEENNKHWEIRISQEKEIGELNTKLKEAQDKLAKAYDKTYIDQIQKDFEKDTEQLKADYNTIIAQYQVENARLKSQSIVYLIGAGFRWIAELLKKLNNKDNAK